MSKETDDQARALQALFTDPSEARAVEYAKTYLQHTTDFRPEALLAGVHKVRLVQGTREQADESRAWLLAHGYKPSINPRLRRV